MKLSVKVSVEAMVRALRVALLDSKQRVEESQHQPSKERDDVPRS